jgi:hypothetical protein
VTAFDIRMYKEEVDSSVLKVLLRFFSYMRNPARA